ncbi:hypothetical protein B484DRAFT_401664 [Ochromonadaceae sp. CCMP2298]|nr:hypothetical protein B484DRAFT_401664 [Ochromonadaceae sp. CCMP2298]
MLENITPQDSEYMKQLMTQGVPEHEALKMGFDRKNPTPKQFRAPPRQETPADIMALEAAIQLSLRSKPPDPRSVSTDSACLDDVALQQAISLSLSLSLSQDETDLYNADFDSPPAHPAHPTHPAHPAASQTKWAGGVKDTRETRETRETWSGKGGGQRERDTREREREARSGKGGGQREREREGRSDKGQGQGQGKSDKGHWKSNTNNDSFRSTGSGGFDPQYPYNLGGAGGTGGIGSALTSTKSGSMKSAGSMGSMGGFGGFGAGEGLTEEELQRSQYQQLHLYNGHHHSEKSVNSGSAENQFPYNLGEHETRSRGSSASNVFSLVGSRAGSRAGSRGNVLDGQPHNLSWGEGRRELERSESEGGSAGGGGGSREEREVRRVREERVLVVAQQLHLQNLQLAQNARKHSRSAENMSGKMSGDRGMGKGKLSGMSNLSMGSGGSGMLGDGNMGHKPRSPNPSPTHTHPHPHHSHGREGQESDSSDDDEEPHSWSEGELDVDITQVYKRQSQTQSQTKTQTQTQAQAQSQSQSRSKAPQVTTPPHSSTSAPMSTSPTPGSGSGVLKSVPSFHRPNLSRSQSTSPTPGSGSGVLKSVPSFHRTPSFNSPRSQSTSPTPSATASGAPPFNKYLKSVQSFHSEIPDTPGEGGSGKGGGEKADLTLSPAHQHNQRKSLKLLAASFNIDSDED